MLKRLLVVLFLALPLSADEPRLLPAPDAAVASNSSNPAGFRLAGSIAFFRATDAAHGTEVWRTDGTPEGTFLLRDFREGPDDSFVTIIGNVGNLALLDEARNGVRTIWSSDGTTAGTRKIAEIPATGSNFWLEIFPADTRVFFVITTTYTAPRELWASDLSPESFRKVGAYPISSSPNPVGANGRLFFVAGSTAADQRLWVSDGSALRTHVVGRRTECPGPACGPKPAGMFRLNGSVSFVTEDALWQTDGTQSGTRKEVPLDKPQLIAISPSTAYLAAGGKLWRTDGSSTGTRAAGTYTPNASSYKVVLDDGRLLQFEVQGNNSGPIRLNPGDGTDPVEIGTYRLAGPRSSGPFLGALGNRVLFATAPPLVSNDVELWALDVDARTQELVQDVDPRSGLSGPEPSQPESGVVLNGRVLFSARTLLGRELWSTDGTAAGTTLLKNINPDGQGGIVTGRILSVTGTPIAGATANLCRTETVCENFTRSDAEGRFRFEGVAPGDYAVAATHLQYVAQFYDRVDCPCAPGSAKRIEVTAGFEVSGIEFALKKGGVITGTVRRTTGEPILFTPVVVRDAQGTVVHQTTAFGEGGSYTTRGLAPGQYWVETRVRFNEPFVDQIHPAQNCIPAPCTIAMGQPVTVQVDSTVANIDFALHEYKTIAGTVRNTAGAPVEFARVEFVKDGRAAAEAFADANGVYRSAPLAPGSYFVRVQPSEVYEGAVYPDAPCPTYDCTPAGTAIALGIEPVTGIDLALPQKAARIVGIVRDRNGAPFADIRVLLLDHEGYFAGHFGDATTNAAGRYAMNLVPPGRYWILAHDELYPGVDCFSINPCSSMQGATPIDVTAGKTLTLDMQLRSERTIIRGRVIDAKTGTGIVDPNGLWVLSAATGKGVPSLDSDGPAAGQYEIRLISRENSFYVIASANGWHRTAHPDRRLACDVYTLCVPPGAVAVGAGVKTGIDITMTPKGAIGGTVTHAVTGKPINHAQVFFTRNGVFAGNTFTEADGRYRWQHGDGSYNVHVEPYGSPPFTAQIYPNRDCAAACDPKTGDLVTATDGMEVLNVDFRVKQSSLYGGISGRVVDDETGAGIPNVYVSASRDSTSYSARTDSQGNYTFDEDVAAGDYRMYAETSHYYVSVYGGNHCPDFYTCDRAGGTLVRVTGTQVTGGIHFRLIRLRAKSITPAAGPPEGGTRIVIAGTHFPPDAKVKIGESDAQIVNITPSEIVAIVPPGPIGPAHVTVIASQSRSATLAHGYTYTSTSPRRRNTRH